jgi:tetratricopeptide (TPR) repeat protein
MSERTGAAVKDAWRLRDERDFLVRSIDDAAREHAAGDLADADYALLRRRDEARLAEVKAALAAVDAKDAESFQGERAPGDLAGAGPVGAEEDVVPADGAWPAAAPAEASGRTGRRRWLALVGVACLVAGVVVLLVGRTSARLPGQVSSGSTELNAEQKVQQQLAQAATLVEQGNSSEALSLYGQVLSEDPKDPVALAWWGWLDWQAAVSSDRATATVAAEGASAVDEAVRLDPRLYQAQYFVGAVDWEDHKVDAAVTHLSSFLAAHPSKAWRTKAAPVIRAAYAAANRPVPSDVPEVGSGAGTSPGG